MRRRAFLGGLTALPLLSWADTAAYPRVTPGRTFVFPRDYGAHPEFRTEWWYVTGWLEGSVSGPMGFQITFFRARPEEQSNNPSSFNPRQIILAHAALADPKRGELLTDQRAARAGFSLAHAEIDRTGVWVDDWRLELEGDRYQARISGRDIDLDLTLFAGKPAAEPEMRLDVDADAGRAARLRARDRSRQARPEQCALVLPQRRALLDRL